MTDSNALLKEFEDARTKYQKLISEKGQLLLASLFKSIFETCPKIQKIHWTQYTPYFNDGDECVFGVNERRFVVEGVCYEDDDPYEWAEAVKNTSSSYFKKYIAPKWGNVGTDTIKKIAELDDKLRALDDSIFRETFGDHSSIIATLVDGKVQFAVDSYYEHD